MEDLANVFWLPRAPNPVFFPTAGLPPVPRSALPRLRKPNKFRSDVLPVQEDPIHKFAVWDGTPKGNEEILSGSRLVKNQNKEQ